MNTLIGTYFHSSRARSFFGGKQTDDPNEPVDIFGKSSLKLASCFQHPVFKDMEISNIRKLNRYLGQGEGVFNDILMGTGELLKKSLGNFVEMAKPFKSLALKSGVALLGPIGLVAAACLLAADGPQEFLEGCKERNLIKGLEGARSSLLAGEALAMAGQLTFSISPGLLSKVVGIVGKSIAPPLAVAQIVVDTAQGVAKVAKSRKTGDKRLLIDGLTDMGVATALSLGIVLGPAVSVPLAGAMLVGKLLNEGAAKREQAVDRGYVQSKSSPQSTTSKYILSQVGPSSVGRVAR